MVMQRPLGSTTAFSIDSLIGGPPQPSPGHFVYTGYPMFMPYRSVVLQPPPPPPPALQQALPSAHHPQMQSLQSGFCSSLAQGLTQGMALTSTLMASLPGGFSPSQQHQEAARKFGSQALHAAFEKTQELRLEAEDGKSFLPAKESALPAFHDADTPLQTSTGRRSIKVYKWFKHLIKPTFIQNSRLDYLVYDYFYNYENISKQKFPKTILK